ncbi:MAG: CRTAC1 family protein [Rhizobiaceae bacterium]
MRLAIIGLAVALGCVGAAAALAEENAPTVASPAVPTYAEETAGAGLAHTFAGEWEFMVGGGVATFDCNDDGYPDMLLSGGENPAALYRNVSTRGGPLKFEKATSGLELEKVGGAYAVDVDSDGIRDVILLRVGENVAMRGLGGCRFERANEAWGFSGGDLWWTSLAAIWEKGAAWPTIAVGSYIDRHEEISPWGSCTDNWLLRPAAGGGGFGPPALLEPGFCPLSIMFTDWNRSGAPSLRVSNDREYYEGGQEQMWKIEPGKEPALYTAQEGWKPLRIWGMGIAGYDLDFDGYPEYFLTSMADSKLQVLAAIPAEGDPKPSYADVAYARGVTAHRPYVGDDLKPSTGWHTQFEDVNNDGLVDLFIAKGNVWEMPDFAMKDPNNLLLQKPDGKFEEAGDRAGVASFDSARGASLTDFNLDGLVDLVVVNRNSPSQLWRNASGDAGGFIQLSLVQDGANRDAIGAWVEVKCSGFTMRREIAVGGGHAGGDLGWRHFGIGDEPAVEVRVTWPDGTEGPWQRVERNGFYVVERGEPVRAWTAG